MLTILLSHFLLTALAEKAKVWPRTTRQGFMNRLRTNPGQFSVYNFQVNWYFWLASYELVSCVGELDGYHVTSSLAVDVYVTLTASNFIPGSSGSKSLSSGKLTGIQERIITIFPIPFNPVNGQ